MINPLLTVVFDAFLIGSAGAVIAAMIDEARQDRREIGAATRPLRKPAVSAAHRSLQDVQGLCGGTRPRKFRMSVG